jgi:5S rRNA maturation endonuclease (ribonuclease M5)
VDAEGVIDVCEKMDLLHGHPYTGDQRGPHISISCPLAPWRHGDDIDANKSCSVTLNEDGPSMARCHSFNCDYKGSFFRLVQKSITQRDDPPEHLLELLRHLNEVEKDTIENACNRIGIKLEKQWGDRKIITPQAAPPDRNRDVLDESVLEPFAGMVPKYVFRRGLSLEACKVWELGYDTAMGRLVFPVRRHDGALIGMTGRILPEVARDQRQNGYEPTKYHNYSGLNKTLYLYGAHLWKKGLPVVLTEGPLDAVRTWMALKGLANVGATLGQGFSLAHRKIIKAAWAPGVYIFGDSDEAGQRMSEKVHHHLSGAVPMLLMRCPTRTMYDEDGETWEKATDPGELSDMEIQTVFKTATPILDQIDW